MISPRLLNPRGYAKSLLVGFALASIILFSLIQGCKTDQPGQNSASQTAGTEDQYPGSNWKYTVESTDDLIQSEMINNKIALTPYAKSLGFHVRKNASGNYSAQTAPGITPNLFAEEDIFHSPSHDCSNAETVGANLPDTIILWNDDGSHVAILTYCVDSANGRVEYNNDASRKMTHIVR